MAARRASSSTALVTPAEVQENQPCLDLLWRARFRWKLRPRQVTGDTNYGTVENIVAIEDAGHPRLRAACRRSASGTAVLRRAGLHLRRRRATPTAARAGRRCASVAQCDTDAAAGLQAPAAACNACALKPQCTDSASGAGASAAASTRPTWTGCAATTRREPYAKAMRKRQVWVEPLFAEAKDWHGLRRFRLRGLEKVNGEALLIAAGQNLKRLLSRWGWGRRPFPSGAAGVVLPAAAGPPAPVADHHAAPARRPAAPHRPPSPFSTGWGLLPTVSCPIADCAGVNRTENGSSSDGSPRTLPLW